jgi:hypothetical protein
LDDSGGVTAGSGFSAAAPAAGGVLPIYKIVTSPGTYHAIYTSGSDPWLCMGFTLKGK